jgi:hypothetical protein
MTMTLETIRQTLYESAKLKMPTFVYNGDGSTPPRAKIEALEDYILKTARWRGHLEQARLYAQDATRKLQRDWAHMQGWEAHRREGERSVASVEDAKRVKDPALYDSIQEGEALVKDLSAAIRRLEHDDEVASRAYTFVVGGG